MAIKMPFVKQANAEQKAAAFIGGAGACRGVDAVEPAAGRTVVNMKIDNALLRQIDAAARRHGISRTAFYANRPGSGVDDWVGRSD
jgi:hypothetical protein